MSDRSAILSAAIGHSRPNCSEFKVYELEISASYLLLSRSFEKFYARKDFPEKNGRKKV